MIHCGDLFDVLPTLPENSIDAACTDPPYEIGFMSKGWDSAGVAFQVETWRQVYRVLKPGAHMLVAGIGRTHHRMMVAVEDAGFEVRDCIYHLFGSGFPKSANVSKLIDQAAGAERNIIGKYKRPDGTDRDYSDWAINSGEWKDNSGFNPSKRDITAPATDAAKQWDGWGTALKPAAEIWTLFRKPLVGSVAQNILTHGTGALNIDACRVGTDMVEQGRFGRCDVPSGSIANEGGIKRATPTQSFAHGRWPSNVILGCCGQDPHDPGCAVALLDAQSGISQSPQSYTRNADGYGWEGQIGEPAGKLSLNFGDTGGASRFFYIAKPSREERDYGCWDLPARSGGEATDRIDGSAGVNSPRAGAGRTGGARNVHPTVKPVELMRYLVRLITPPNGTVLDPFAGSGTTGMACRYELRKFIGVEREAEYVAIAERRIANCAPLFGDEASA